MPPSLPLLGPPPQPQPNSIAAAQSARTHAGPGGAGSRFASQAMGGTQNGGQANGDGSPPEPSASASSSAAAASACAPSSSSSAAAGASSSCQPTPPPSSLPAPPPSALQLFAKSEKLEEELRLVERDLYDLETGYLQDANQTGSVLRGFDGFLSARSNVTSTKRPRKFQTEDRVFSLSSATSLASEEGTAVRDPDGRMDGGFSAPLPGGGATGPASQSRMKQSTSTYSSATAAGTPSSGPGKQNSQKRGRSGISQREGKKLRQQLEHEDSDDDDSQTSSLA